MVFIRRTRSPRGPDSPRILVWQVGLFFLAAGVWLAGVLAGDDRITGAAIALLLLAVVLRLVRDRTGGSARDRASEDEDDAAFPPRG